MCANIIPSLPLYKHTGTLMVTSSFHSTFVNMTQAWSEKQAKGWLSPTTSQSCSYLLKVIGPMTPTYNMFVCIRKYGGVTHGCFRKMWLLFTRFWCSCSRGTHFATNPQVKSLGNSLGISSYHLMEGSLQTSTCLPCQEYGKAGNGNEMEMQPLSCCWSS